MKVTAPLELVERYGSPLYVYELEAVRAAHAALQAALPRPSDLYYSLKANPHAELVRELGRLGCGAEVSSPGEIRTALAAGIPARRCLHTGPGKTSGALAVALAAGIRHFSVDSLAQLQRLDDEAGRAGAEVEVVLRINPEVPVGGFALEMVGCASQFGVDTSWVLEHGKDVLGTTWARLRGFHLFLGTSVHDVDALCRSLRFAVLEAKHLSEALGLPLAWLDLGGGFANPFARAGDRPDYSAVAHAVGALLDAELPGWRDGVPRVAFESGRYLVGAAGTLVCTVQDTKRSKGRTFVIVDSGIHHLAGMSGMRRVPQITPTLLVGPNLEDEGEPTLETDVVGELCTPLDSWARRVELRPVSVGDVLAIPNVGAYGLTASLIAFLGHDMPVELVLDGGRVVHASRLRLTRVEGGHGPAREEQSQCR